MIVHIIIQIDMNLHCPPFSDDLKNGEKGRQDWEMKIVRTIVEISQ